MKTKIDFVSNSSSASFIMYIESTVNNIDDFKANYSALLRDFNTAGVVTSHLGSRLSLMRANYYNVHGQRVQLNRERIQECCDAVDAILARI